MSTKLEESGRVTKRLKLGYIGCGLMAQKVHLPNFAAWARLLRHGVPSSPIRLDLADTPIARRPSPHRLITTSRMRFGRPRTEVEARIRKFLGA